MITRSVQVTCRWPLPHGRVQKQADKEQPTFLSVRLTFPNGVRGSGNEKCVSCFSETKKSPCRDDLAHRSRRGDAAPAVRTFNVVSTGNVRHLGAIVRKDPIPKWTGSELRACLRSISVEPETGVRPRCQPRTGVRPHREGFTKTQADVRTRSSRVPCPSRAPPPPYAARRTPGRKSPATRTSSNG